MHKCDYSDKITYPITDGLKDGMEIIICTSSNYKTIELSKYFHNIGLKTHLIKKYDEENLKQQFLEYICIREQTQLINKYSPNNASLDKFEEVLHKSVVTLTIYKNKIIEDKKFYAEVEGFIFPNLKTTRSDIYDWDDIFISSSTMKSYQEMKDNGIKNSARDLAFAQVIDYLPDVFTYAEKTNLKFNPVIHNEIISFEPVIKNLFDNNNYYQVAYKNEVFNSIVNHIINDGLFIRRASNRHQKNYWLPGLNAGIPLTPKKDELHELTFMFHDIMHFLYPDLVLLDDSIESKNKYIISRMMSEAFTLVLADMLFISLLKDSNIEYDYNKRKIYPLFENMKFEITQDNLPQIKQLLWANVLFAVLGQDEPLKVLVKNDIVFEAYKNKYQRFFQEDYEWTSHNCNNMSKQCSQTLKWYEMLKFQGISIPNTKDFCPEFNIDLSLLEQVEIIFECMFGKLESVVKKNESYNSQQCLTNAVRKYIAGQIYIFFKFETLYNLLFLSEIMKIVTKDIITKDELNTVLRLYEAYINKLGKDNFISPYEVNNFKNIYPIFEPFYVFYDQKESKDFASTLKSIFCITK